jgi:hypothetical protein
MKSIFLLCTLLAGVVNAHAVNYEWVKTDFSDLQTGDMVVLVDEHLDNIALPNDDGNFEGVPVDVQGTKLSGTVSDNIQWKIRKNDDTEALAGLFINENGTKQILAAIQKTNDRSKEKTVQPDTSNDPRRWNAAEWKYIFAKIKDDYTKFKKEHGDKAALELSETVNKLSGDDNVLAAMSKLFGYKIEKNIAARFLYVFLLDVKHYGWLNPMYKDDRFVRLFKKFNPGKDV